MIYLQTRQTVFPKSIYVGDRAEIRCQFTTDVTLTEGAISSQNFTSLIDYSVCEIKDITLQSAGAGNNSYTLIINFVPWHTGSIHLPDFEIYLPSASEENIVYGTIHFEEIKVLSLVEQKGVNSLQDYASPLLLPGTAYKIYGSIAAFIILLIILIRLIVKRHAVAFWFKTMKLRLRYRRNKKNTIRALKALEPEKDSATLLQKIMRQYLEVRLEYPFTKTLTSEMSLAFDRATLSLADENKQTAFENIISIFVRTDYIRFSSSGSFEDGEFSALVNNLIDDILVIEEGKNA